MTTPVKVRMYHIHRVRGLLLDPFRSPSTQQCRPAVSAHQVEGMLPLTVVPPPAAAPPPERPDGHGGDQFRVTAPRAL